MKTSNAIRVYSTSEGSIQKHDCSDSFTIGKSKAADLTLKSNYLSRNHLHVFKKNNVIYLQDLNSANGTFVNNKRMLPEKVYEYHEGTIIHLGSHDLEIRLEQIQKTDQVFHDEKESPPCFKRDTVITSESGMNNSEISSQLKSEQKILQLVNNEISSTNIEQVTDQIDLIREQRKKLLDEENERQLRTTFLRQQLESEEKILLMTSNAQRKATELLKEAELQASQIIESAEKRAHELELQIKSKSLEIEQNARMEAAEIKRDSEEEAKQTIADAEKKSQKILEQIQIDLKELKSERNEYIQRTENQIKSLRIKQLELEKTTKAKEIEYRQAVDDCDHAVQLLDQQIIELQALDEKQSTIENALNSALKEKEEALRSIETEKEQHEKTLKLRETESERLVYEAQQHINELFKQSETIQQEIKDLEIKAHELRTEISELETIKKNKQDEFEKIKNESSEILSTYHQMQEDSSRLIKEANQYATTIRLEIEKQKNEAEEFLKRAQEDSITSENTIRNNERLSYARIQENERESERKIALAQQKYLTLVENIKKLKIESDKRLKALQLEADGLETKINAKTKSLLKNAEAERNKILEEAKRILADAQTKVEKQITLAQSEHSKILHQTQKEREEFERWLTETKAKEEQEINDRREKAIHDLEVELTEKLVVNEEKEKKYIEKIRSKARKQDKERIDNIDRNIQQSIILLLKKYQGHRITPETCTALNSSISDIVQIAFGLKSQSTDSLSSLLFTRNRPHIKKFWAKIALTMTISIIAIVLYIMFPNAIGNARKFIVSSLTFDKTAGELFIQKIQEARKNKPVFTPPKDELYRATYAENILFYRNFIEIISENDFQKSWIVEANKFLVNDLLLGENLIVEVSSIENGMIYELVLLAGNIKPDNMDRTLDEMREIEKNAEGKIIPLLKNERNYRRFTQLRRSFFEQFQKEHRK